MSTNERPRFPLNRRRFLELAATTAGGTAAVNTGAAAAHAAPASGDGDPLPSGRYQLTITTDAAKPAVTVTDSASGTVVLNVANPLQIVSVKNGDGPFDFEGRYATVRRRGDRLVATGHVESTYGSQFRFDDTYSAIGDSGEFELARIVTVVKANTDLDLGFNSRFALGPADAQSLRHYQFLAPGIWYDRNENVPSGALAGNYNDSYFYFREMRLPLPFIMMHDPASRVTFSIGHVDPDPRSDWVDEGSGLWWIDETISYASLGAHRIPSVQLAVVFPGMEGQRNYVDRGAGWLRRGNPVELGFTQTYTMRITVATSDDFPAAVRETWRYYYDLFSPEIAKVPARRVYDAAIGLLAHYAKPYNGAPGIPFRTRLPSGHPDASSMQMGFIGQQLPAAYLLLRHGVLRRQRAYAQKGKDILDFWTTNASHPSGLPRIWYNVVPASWRDGYPIYTRIASDGMEGVLRACKLMRDRNQGVRAWEDFAAAFGAWLVSHQNSDGSYYRSYNQAGTGPVDTARYNSHNPIPFLLALADYTGDNRYRHAAIRAGEFTYQNTHVPAKYIGGTPDNNNVIDKEAAALALRAFLRLYHATGDRKWLEAAKRAADFAETWAYAWNYKVKTHRAAYTKYGVRGQSLIATGHSGMDTWLSASAFDFYQLYRLTKDAHYLHFARLLFNETKVTTEWPGNKLGYAKQGLVDEAISLVDLTYNGVNVWLPWIAVAQAEPYADLEDTYGDMEVDKLRG